jgi:hypothetical protein
MADCDGFTLPVPDINCFSDLEAFAQALTNSLQAGLDHVVACVNDFEYPECDICVLKDDLKKCPLDCQMIDFIGVTYAEEGDVCILPLPTGGLQTRSGTGVSDHRIVDAEEGVSISVVFDTPFDTECVHVDLECTNVIENKMELMHPIVTAKSKTGFTVYWEREDTYVGPDPQGDFIEFTYVAFGL